MKISLEKFVKCIRNAPDARLGMNEEKKRCRRLLLLLAGDERTRKQTSLDEISEMFSDASDLLEVLKDSMKEKFAEKNLVDCARKKRRAV